VQVTRDRTIQPLESLLRAIRKVQPTEPDRITVGRDADNDVVIPDTTVSAHHAWFRERAGRLELVDAGSRNGTWVGALRLPPRGPVGTPIGQRLRFGELTFRLLDAEGLWRLVHEEH
jgi:pSer/pThr/pTyr-binding forkhead associated (FHA) protein